MNRSGSTKGYDFGRLSFAVIGACQDVQRQLGLHCMEVDYQRALEIAFNQRSLAWQREVEIPIAYDNVVITRRRVDFLVEQDDEQLILETKAASQVLPEDVEQCLLYLHQGGYRLSVCAYTRMTFGPRITRKPADHTEAGGRAIEAHSTAFQAHLSPLNLAPVAQSGPQ